MKKILSVLILLVTVFQAYPQGNQIVPVSPEAAALAKMVNYPINLNTGLPDISIPLYTVNTGGMELPITLTYHAGGFRANESSTRTGMGWSLTCDLQIVRNINGLDDFESGRGYITDPDITDHNYSSSGGYPFYTQDGWMRQYRLAVGEKDGAPDKFTYKLLNKAGSFYFKKNSTGTGYSIVPVPYENIQIAFNNGEFKVVDTDGTTYFFGAQGVFDIDNLAASYKEITKGITAWKCRMISNANDTHQIDFSYIPKGLKNRFVYPEQIEYYSRVNPVISNEELHTGLEASQYQWLQTYEHLVGMYKFYTLSCPKYMVRYADRSPEFHLPYYDGLGYLTDYVYKQENVQQTGIYMQELSLSEITFREGKIKFTGANQLSSILVQKMDGAELRSFNFAYSKTYSATGSDYTLYLDSINTKVAEETHERYGLIYKDKPYFGTENVGQDMWGNWNANTRNRFAWNTTTYPSIVPGRTINERFYRDAYNYNDVQVSIGSTLDAERAHRDLSQSGMLKRIIYPTGGFVQFEYESHKYKIANTGNNYEIGMGGGLRVQSVSHYDGKSMYPVNRKIYKYGDLEDGLGQVLVNPGKTFNMSTHSYDNFFYEQEVVYAGAYPNYMGDRTKRSCLELKGQEKKTVFLPASNQNCTYPNGASTYYTKVTEYNSDLGKETGKKVYRYYPANEFTTIASYEMFPQTNIPILQTNGLIGQLKRLEDYKYEKGLYKLVHSKEFQFKKYSQPSGIKVVLSYMGGEVKVVGSGWQGSDMDLYDPHYSIGSSSMRGFTCGQYGIEVGKLLLEKETEKWIYSNNDSLMQETSYSYDEFQQPSQITTVSSEGTSVSKQFKYCYDFSGQTVFDQMLSRNMISQPIQQKVLEASSSKEISNTITNYLVFNNSLIAPASISKSFNGKPSFTEVTYDLYDDVGNLLQLTEEGGLVKSYIWGYNKSSLLAEVIGMDYAAATQGLDLAILQTTTDTAQLRSVFKNLRPTKPQAFISSFTYNPQIGISSQTSPAGVDMFFQYDPLGRLEVVRDYKLNIVKRFNYNMLNVGASSVAYYNYGVQLPEMESLNRLVDGSNTIFNYIQQGDYSPGFNTPYSPSIDQNGVDRFLPTEKDGLKTADVTFYLSCGTTNTENLGIGLHLDVIKDGSVVYTKKFVPTPVASQMYGQGIPLKLVIPQGEYLLNLRVDENFDNKSFTAYYSGDASSGGFYITDTITVNASPSTIYSITIFPN